MIDQSKEMRSRIMACIKSSGNMSTEKSFISILKANSITGWRRNYPGYGKPDFVFLSMRIAVFVDGCFWHKCPKHCRLPSSNVEYWNNKINRNADRDRHVSSELKKKGWIVVRFWEHDLKAKRLLSQKISQLKKLTRKS